jgi:Rieske Fe-S protein
VHILGDEFVVVTQPVANTFRGFDGHCTHRGCIVAMGNGLIQCPCHQSRFALTDGSVINGPATQPLARFRIRVADGYVYPA